MRAKRPKRQCKIVYCIVVEGKTEQWYLQLIKKHEALPEKIDIKPELPKRRGFNELKDLLNDFLKTYDRVFWVIDLDHFINNHQIENLKNIITLLRKDDKHKKLEILINNPCLEFWYLLHFRNTGKEYSGCEPVIKEIKKCGPLSNYQKTEKYYKGSRDIYQKLKPYQKNAVENAWQLDKLNQGDICKSNAQIYKLLKILNLI